MAEESKNKLKDEVKEALAETAAIESDGGKLHFIWQENKAEIIHEETAVSFTGIISSPADWLKQRIEGLEQKKAHVIVSPDDFQIDLIIEERSHFKDKITGKIEFDPLFKKLKINTEEEYSSEQWAKLFKKHKYIFPSLADANRIITQLTNFKVKIDQEVEKSKDNQGNNASAFRRTVTENNLPSSFEISVAIFKGHPKEKLDVVFEVSHTDLSLSLWSDHAMMQQDKLRDDALNAVIEDIKSVAPGIVILEK